MNNTRHYAAPREQDLKSARKLQLYVCIVSGAIVAAALISMILQ